jgi:hypothetical protein
MIKFKAFFKESTGIVLPPGFGPTTARTKFQEGDFVLTKRSGAWTSMQPKKSHPYFDQAGEVVGYRNVPGAYSKFAIKFPDGVVLPFHGHYIFGPFKSLQVAQSYIGKDPNSIKPDDVHNRVEVLSELAKSEPVENELKKLFTSSLFNFNWLKDPKTYEVRGILYTILAICPIASTPFFSFANKISTNNFFGEGVTDHEYSCYLLVPDLKNNEELENILKNNFVVLRVNNGKTRKAANVKTQYSFLDLNFIGGTPYAFSYANLQDIYYDAGILALRTPDEVLKESFKKKELINTRFFNVNTSLTRNIIKNKDKLEILNKVANDDVDAAFDFVYRNSKSQNKDELAFKYGTFNLSDVNAEYFKNYTIGQNITYYTKTGDIKIPKKVKGSVYIIGVHKNDKDFKSITSSRNYAKFFTDKKLGDDQSISLQFPTITDFSFLRNTEKGFTCNHVNIPEFKNVPDDMKTIDVTNCNVKNLYGLPEELDMLRVNDNQLTSLEGDVKKIENTFAFYRNPIRSLEGLPEAGYYDVDNETRKRIEDYKKFKELGLSSDTEDIFKDFYT